MRLRGVPAVALVFAGCGDIGANSGAPVPDVARVLCVDEGTRVETPLVRPQADGVHIRVINRTERDLSFDIRDVGGDNAGGEQVWARIAPGQVEVRCSNSLGGDDPPYVSFEVMDPEDLWVSPEVDCALLGGISVGHGDYVEEAEGDPRDPLLIAGDRFGALAPGEVVERAGYPEAENALVRLTRNGRVKEVVEYTRDASGTGWLETEHRKCS